MSQDNLSLSKEQSSENRNSQNIFIQMQLTQPSNCNDIQSVQSYSTSPTNEKKCPFSLQNIVNDQQDNHNVKFTNRCTERQPFYSTPELNEYLSKSSETKPSDIFGSQSITKFSQSKKRLENALKQCQTPNVFAFSDVEKDIKTQQTTIEGDSPSIHIEIKNNKMKQNLVQVNVCRIIQILAIFSSIVYTYAWFLYATGELNQPKDSIKIKVMNTQNISEQYLVYIPIVLISLQLICQLYSNLSIIKKLKESNTISLRLLTILKVSLFSFEIIPVILVLIYSNKVDSNFKIAGIVCYSLSFILQLYYIYQYQSFLDNTLELNKRLEKLQSIEYQQP